MYELSQIAPSFAQKIKDEIYATAKTGDGQYRCNNCGKISSHKALFNIDHIFPMSKGGKTKTDNLQLLCRPCNIKKGNNV